MAAPFLTPRAVIRTPDQRLRVFVSSTLKELAAERKVARAAIERLAAAPVMFELGARPHPPRALYRAYLEQSDIFVGLYWEKYGWVAPDEKVSGLEDEYNLAPPSMPKLIYIKDTGGTREPRLTQLLDRIRSDDMASFKYFSGPAELGDLLVADLAILLAERFDESRAAPAPRAPEAEEPPAPAAEPSDALPVTLTQLVGRDRELEEIGGMLRDPAVRLVTLNGSGGIGKTRLAIEIGRRMADEFPDGVAFVPLAPVDSAAHVATAIAQVLAVRDTGDLPLEDKLVTALRDRHALLILDNFEHVLDAAPLVAALLEGAPETKILVTSRTLLRLLGEHSVDVSPLELPAPRVGPWRPEAPLAASVALFVQRARAVKPDFDLTADNIDAVEKISVRLEGVPLAIELAAARIRLLSPASLLERLDRQLALLVGGQRNLPPRQQAVRSTIEWSTRLLGIPERNLLWRLGVFAGRFSLEAVEAVAEPGSDVLTLLETLVDSSLVRQQDRSGRTYFLLLATVREYALEQLEVQGLLRELQRLHARHYVAWSRRAGPRLLGPQQRELVALLSEERDNLRAVAHNLAEAGEWETLADFSWALYLYWWIGGQLGEVRGWMDALLGSGDRVPDRTRAIALYFTGAIRYWQAPTESIVPILAESADLFRKSGLPAGEALTLNSVGLALVTQLPPDLPGATEALQRSIRLFQQVGGAWGAWGEGFAQIVLGRLQLVLGNVEGGLPHFEAALRLAEQQQDDLALAVALHDTGWAHLLLGHAEEARKVISRGLEISVRLDHDEGIAYGLEAFVGIAALSGDPERAGFLAGAARSRRERVGQFNPADFTFHARMLDQLRAGGAGELVDRGFEAGRRASRDEAVAVAREIADSRVAS
ncbi:DUF4062 domain-containing protein [Naasia sp. SYSU D00948]|uniref:DUF4062 domain-containing protein n=1 Tax=Naasia sp. SYSU D00948 TaxID=2817379 RepID=UPI001B3087A1|nr:DUF4062 domain-containing protein [Naasia sp. SYSU D00948]